ncbi:unnamed protein product [Haemonchus placei]|uniref:BAR domain-containing protein n=1 Tax=Haemonchus placei TaxID=6290 RepID=A0A0N4WLC8_HAEPC|nr:unnamed protein product [Haemonchus placei]
MYKNLGSADGHEELDEIKATCERHADLCRQYAKCSLDLQMNDAQLEILSETAETLRQRHAQIRRTIDEKPQRLSSGMLSPKKPPYDKFLNYLGGKAIDQGLSAKNKNITIAAINGNKCIIRVIPILS